MGRSVLAVENTLSYLVEIAQPDRYSVGLILGQSTTTRDYVIHLARTPSMASKEVEEEGSPETSDTDDEPEVPVIKQIADVNDSWVADHAKHVTRMLPGGIWVLGIFVVGPDDVFANAGTSARVRTILAKMGKSLSNNMYLHGNAPVNDKLVLFLNSNTHKFHCKSIESNKPGTSTVDWKFQVEPTRWHRLDCVFDFDQLYPISCSLGINQTIKSNFQDILEKVSNKVDRAVCMIDGEQKDESQHLAETQKKQRKNKATGEMEAVKACNVSLYMPQDTTDPEMDADDCSGELNVLGVVASRVFVHQKATVGEAIRAVKQDVIRSMAARLEMHWDSLIDEESGSPEELVTLHEPPRRVLVTLPHCDVALSDYLFPGEGPSDALVSLHELLDLKLLESDVHKDLETQADSSEFYAGGDMEPAEGEQMEEVVTPVTPGPLSMVIAMVAFTIFILVASIVIQNINNHST